MFPLWVDNLESPLFFHQASRCHASKSPFLNCITHTFHEESRFLPIYSKVLCVCNFVFNFKFFKLLMINLSGGFFFFYPVSCAEYSVSSMSSIFLAFVFEVYCYQSCQPCLFFASLAVAKFSCSTHAHSRPRP